MTETGYAIRTTGYHRDGTVYRDGYNGENWYESEIDAYLYDTKEELFDSLKYLRNEYVDGTVKFTPCFITRTINVIVEEIPEKPLTDKDLMYDFFNLPFIKRCQILKKYDLIEEDRMACKHTEIIDEVIEKIKEKNLNELFWKEIYRASK